MSRSGSRFLVIAAAFVVAVASVSIPSGSASAVKATDFQAGRIIDDEIFYNSNAFASAAEVQGFINSHTPACDTWGTQPSGYGNLTRAQYAQQIKGWPGPPYVCLQNYHENPQTGETSYEKGGGAFAGGLSAAEIIYNAAKQYRINPQVLLVMLKKESPGPLFSDSWPLKSQYKYAMGYACPDSGPNYSAACESSKAGFYKQVTLAAWQLRYYADNITQYNYQPGRWNYIQYSPTPSCGGKSVYIENMATASLYIYTPYVPNQAALEAYPGEASCGAYGNRNFFMMFSEWFGSTYGSVNLISDLSISHDQMGKMYTGERTVSYTVRNNSNQTIDMGEIGVASRSPSGRTDGFAMKKVVLKPYETYTYTDTQSHFTEEGDYRFWIVTLKDGVYREDLPASSASNLVRQWWVYIQAAPTVVGNVSIPQTRPTQNANVDVTYRIRNNSSSAVQLGDMGVRLRFEDGATISTTKTPSVTIPAGQEREISSSIWLPRIGGYTVEIVNSKDGGTTWNTTFPLSQSTTIQRSLQFTAKTPVSIQATPSVSPAQPLAGQDVTASFRIKNYTLVDYIDGQIGLAVRDEQNGNVGYDMQPFNVPANGELVYNVSSRYFNKPGLYTAWLVRYEGGVYTEYGVGETPDVKSRFTFQVLPNLNLIETPSFTKTSIHANENVGSVLKIQNTAGTQARGQAVGLAVRDPQNVNVGYAMQDLVVSANGTFNYSVPQQSFNRPGQYKAWIVQYDGVNYNDYSKLANNAKNTVYFDVKPDATLQTEPSLTPASPRVGQSVTATFKIKNYSKYPAVDYPVGLVVIDPNGKNVGYAMQEINIPVGGEFNYTVPAQTFTTPGVYTAWITQNSNGYWSEYKKVEDSSTKTKIQFTVTP